MLVLSRNNNAQINSPLILHLPCCHPPSSHWWGSCSSNHGTNPTTRSYEQHWCVDAHGRGSTTEPFHWCCYRGHHCCRHTCMRFDLDLHALRPQYHHRRHWSGCANAWWSSWSAWKAQLERRTRTEQKGMTCHASRELVGPVCH